jgi:hypothetical protein
MVFNRSSVGRRLHSCPWVGASVVKLSLLDSDEVLGTLLGSEDCTELGFLLG